jgi:hypothetical protein
VLGNGLGHGVAEKNREIHFLKFRNPTVLNPACAVTHLLQSPPYVSTRIEMHYRYTQKAGGETRGNVWAESSLRVLEELLCFRTHARQRANMHHHSYACITLNPTQLEASPSPFRLLQASKSVLPKEFHLFDLFVSNSTACKPIRLNSL